MRPHTGVHTWTRAVMLAVAGIITSVVASAPAVAAPGPGDTVDMDIQCRTQYPQAEGFLDGQAYLVAPRDAYSWRCKRVAASPTGGLIAELPVDPNAYCFPYRAMPAANGSSTWTCTA